MTFESRTTPLLAVKNLNLRYSSAPGPVTILQDVSFELGRGEIVGIIGESGAGKSTLGNAILGLLAPGFQRVSGSIELDGKPINAMQGKGDTMAGDGDAIRGRRISAIFQDHTASLDPLMSVGAQVQETILAINASVSRRQARARAIELLARVGIPEPERRYGNYPHQFSGGQRQRAVIAVALAGSADIIIADEPTSALDATVQKQILKLLRTLVDDTGISIVLVTHDMGVVSEITDRVLVMRKGRVVEQDRTAVILDAPANDYTRSLLAAVPRLRISPAAGKGKVHGNATISTSTGAGKANSKETTSTRTSAGKGHASKGEANSSGTVPAEAGADNTMLLVAKGVSKTFARQGFAWDLSRNKASFALRNVSIELPRGAITGIVGESGSGKTTIGRIIAGLDTAPAGTVTIAGNDFDVSKRGGRNGLLGRVQMIFQDPAVSLNPRMSAGETLREAIRFGAKAGPEDEPADAATMMDRLGLARSLLSRYPHQLSGGQKQRICIARALLARPQIIIADEPTSALDVSVQAEIIELLKDTITAQHMTMVFISHDLAVVQQLCSCVYIFKDGQVVDSGSSDFVFSQSTHPYTRTLIDARPARFTC
ncbi:ABC transporter ATP-binding protein [Phyllobacterium ifriqiyense]|uniref:ABC transporter ATP-binding protein n=1 Tax=Phyllobacterium ifriqiyense TaxID=314238 RepID=UPI003393A1CA